MARAYSPSAIYCEKSMGRCPRLGCGCAVGAYGIFGGRRARPAGFVGHFEDQRLFAMAAESATLAFMTVEELKAEAAKLPPDDRFALAEWIQRSDDVRALRFEELIREIQHGVGQADRGELLEADDVFPRLRSNQQASV
jgi:hypothetical protein